MIKVIDYYEPARGAKPCQVVKNGYNNLAFLDSSIRQSGRLLTARFQVRVLVEEPTSLEPDRFFEPVGFFIYF